jgi:thiamine pyrophosphate-dependent acetolactate synthase large subunit-like protein
MSDAAAPADQHRCTEFVLERTPDAAIIANLGVASYVLIDVEDRDRNFYMDGAMASTTPIGIGLSMAIDDPVTVLDGDGSLLMQLGTLATIAEYAPSTLTVVVFDNETYETTGGQPTLSATTDFAGIARNCGLAAWSATTDEEFETAYDEAVAHDGPALVACAVERINPSDHPRLDYGHSYTKHRFRTAVTDE